jgi:phage gpG-like protein
MSDFFKNILSDLRVDLTDEFDKNFERKAFFDKPWDNTKIPNRKGSLMARTNGLRRSMKSKQTNDGLSWTSSKAYATLQNEGGEIVVTDKMKRFFWAMFYKCDGAITMKRDKNKDVVMRDTNRNKRLSEEAKTWRALALQKTGAKMKVKQRQFIGDHPIVRQRIEHIVNANFEELDKEIFKRLKR